MKKILLMLVAGLTGVTLAKEAFTVRTIEAASRKPWNGLVDIVVTIAGDTNEMDSAVCAFAATNAATRAEMSIVTVSPVGTDGLAEEGCTRHYVWNATNDVGAAAIDDVELTVAVKKTPGGVQLWADGPYWAERNVGAAKPESYGYYFWWGDTVGYQRNAADDGWVSVKDGSAFVFATTNSPTYGLSNQKLQTNGYINASGNLAPEHDAATAHLGAYWRMPTKDEMAELLDNCTTTWTTRNGVSGRLLTGKGDYASKSIFLPAAGSGDGAAFRDGGSYGYVWSSTPNTDGTYANDLYFYSSYCYQGVRNRSTGRSVRALRDNVEIPSELSVGVTTHLKLGGDAGSERTDLMATAGLPDGTVFHGVTNVVLTAPESGCIIYYTTNGLSPRVAQDISVYTEAITLTASTPIRHYVVDDAGDYGPVQTVNGIRYCEEGESGRDFANGVWWNYSWSNTVTILSFEMLQEAPVDDLIIPAALGGHAVEHLGNFAQGLSTFRSLTIPDSVRTIAANAFSGCEALTNVTMGSGVRFIRDEAFSDCPHLASVTFTGSAAPDLGSSVFAGTPRELQITVADGSIGWSGGVSTNLPSSWADRALVTTSGRTGNGGRGATALPEGAGTITASITVTNIVVHYVTSSLASASALPARESASFVTIVTEVKGGAFSVPDSWAANFPSFTEKFGTDLAAALSKPTGKLDAVGNAMLVWQDYVAGTDPTDVSDVFKASITLVDGQPVISWTPEITDADEAAKRLYTIYAKEMLTDAKWKAITAADAVNYNFFKVTVEMK